MKKHRFWVTALAALIITGLAGCGAAEETAAVPETEIVAAEVTTTATTTTTAASTTTTAESTETTTETDICSGVPKTETAEITVQTEQSREEYVQVSPGNEFIDFEFIEDYQGTTDIGELGNKAVEFLKSSEYYTEAMGHIGDFTVAEFAPYIKDGKIEPKLKIAYPDDYDGDGSEEAFIVVDMPYHVGSVEVMRDFLIFSGSDGEMEILQDYSGMYPVLLINYGKIKQLTFGGSGIAGVDDRNNLYGVKDGKAVELYAQRGGFYKSDCFLSTFGWQGMGDFMYFDTVEQEYRVIDGVDIDVEDVRAMDTANDLAEVWAESNENFLHIEIIGGKYYCMIRGMMDEGTIYTYENGSFTHLENSNVRISMNACDLKEVVDIDINKAIAEMKPVKK